MIRKELFLRRASLTQSLSAPCRRVVFDVRSTDRRTAMGARVRIRAGERDQWRIVPTTGGYQSNHDVRLHFVIGREPAIEAIEVVSPDESHERFDARPVGAYHRIVQGEGYTCSRTQGRVPVSK